MNTSLHSHPTARTGADRFGQTLLLVNAIALGATGIVQSGFDLGGSFFGLGPMGDYLHGKADTVGFFEAHMLAFIVAVLIVIHRKAPGSLWNWTAAGVHLMLGTANLMFWQIFLDAGQLPLGYVATSAHAIFFVLEASAALGRRGVPALAAAAAGRA